MDCETISPACKAGVRPSEMSSEEFQKMLYTWFEEKGVVAELRCYLRLQMIKMLRNTFKGDEKVQPGTFSLQKQAFSLVIAEYLLREGCHYTLSIFSTEVPAAATLLPFPLIETQKYKDNKWKFDEESVSNLLDLLGVSKNSKESARISVMYHSTSGGSLLNCILSSKLGTAKRTAKEDEEQNVENCRNSSSGNYKELLNVCALPANVSKELQERITAEIDFQVQEERKKNDGMVEDMKQQMRMLLQEDTTLRTDNKKLKEELRHWKKHAKETQLREEGLKVRESLLKERLEERERQEAVHKEREKESQMLLSAAESRPVCNQKHCEETCQSNKMAVEELQKEVVRVQSLNRDRTLEVERLNSKIGLLMRDVFSSQTKIEFLNSCLMRSSKVCLQRGSEAKIPEISDDSSDNATDEILQQVHVRLRELERESDNLDMKFKRLGMVKQ